MLVPTGKMVSGFTFRLARKVCGTTVSCAPVSQMAGLLLVRPGLCADWKNLGWLRPSSAYDFLSTENEATIVGLSLGLELYHPATLS